MTPLASKSAAVVSLPTLSGEQPTATSHRAEATPSSSPAAWKAFLGAKAPPGSRLPSVEVNGSFSPRTGEAAVLLSHLAYKNELQVRSQLHEWNIDLRSFTWLSDLAGGKQTTAVTGFVFTDREGSAHVVLRGTANLRNIAVDLDVLQVSIGEGAGVHRGFDRVAERLWPQVERALSRAKGAKSFVFSGHSLGGAVAQELALKTVQAQGAGALPSAPVAVYSVGAPRVGNAAFVALMDAQVPENYRLVLARKSHGFSGDPVPVVPFESLDYAHAGKEVVINADGAVASLGAELLALGKAIWRDLPAMARARRESNAQNLTPFFDEMLQTWSARVSGAQNHALPSYLRAYAALYRDA